MTTVHLLPHAEDVAPVPRPGAAGPWLDHQHRTVEALRDHALAVNCFETGTGKTEAALSALLLPHLCAAGALIIAPTNELLHQHAETARRFVAAHGLPHRVVPIHAGAVAERREQRTHRLERRGETLERILNDPGALGAPPGSPLLVVTNPDIFYYALYHTGYGPHDRRNLFATFVRRFGYVVVDEVHYYSPKQLACFLFYFAIWREWGYFEQGQRACLLSATPDARLDAYLQRLFPERDAIAWIQPGQPSGGEQPRMPTLAPTTVEIVAGEIERWVAGPGRERLAEWLRAGQDGAVISGALWRINAAHAALAGDPAFRGQVARLTGAETRTARAAAPAFPLVLATPTVDIGYNFEKPGKDRQPLDFIVADAMRGDEAVQRLGRSGRVLGRAQTATPSHAVLLLPEEACTALAPLDGQTLDRRAFRRALLEALPARSGLEHYLRSYAVLEVFRPILEIQRQMASGSADAVDRLIERVRGIFAPGGRTWSDGCALGLWRRHHRMAEVVHGGRGIAAGDFTEDYLRWLADGGTPQEQLNALAEHLRRSPDIVHQLVEPWVHGEYARWDALFHFRDAFEGPAAGVADPRHLLSGADAAVYDLLHVAANFEAEWFPSRAELIAAVGLDPGEGCVAWAHLLRQRPADGRLRLRFSFTEATMAAERWIALHTRRPVALIGLRVLASTPDGADVPLSGDVHRAIADRHVPLLLVPASDKGAFRLQLQRQGAVGRPLEVAFPQEDRTEEFWAVAGTAAYTVHAALRGYFALKERAEAGTPYII